MKSILCVGNSGSGKTTFAEYFASCQNVEWIILSKDNLRRQIFPEYDVEEYWLDTGESLKHYEEFIKELFFIQLDFTLKKFNVIVDVTSANLDEFQRIIEIYKANETEYKIKYFEVPVKVSKKRVKQRDDRTGSLDYIDNYFVKCKNIVTYCKDNNIPVIEDRGICLDCKRCTMFDTSYWDEEFLLCKKGYYTLPDSFEELDNAILNCIEFKKNKKVKNLT